MTIGADGGTSGQTQLAFPRLSGEYSLRRAYESLHPVDVELLGQLSSETQAAGWGLKHSNPSKGHNRSSVTGAQLACTSTSTDFYQDWSLLIRERGSVVKRVIGEKGSSWVVSPMRYEATPMSG